MSGSREQIKEGVVQVKDPVAGTCFLSMRNPSGMTGINLTIEVSAVVRERVGN